MYTLLMRFVGPLQAWGTTSRFDERDTGLEPSKSGAIGLICAALGRDRAEPVDDLAALSMGVRVDREGMPLRDFHTATGVLNALGKPRSEPTVISSRFYLSDAAFLVGLAGHNRTLLEGIQHALQTPVWPIFLGRKACVPSYPVWLPDGVQQGAVREVLIRWPRIAPPQRTDQGRPVRLVLEHESEGAVRMDQPVAPFAERRFGPRFIRTEMVDVPDTVDA